MPQNLISAPEETVNPAQVAAKQILERMHALAQDCLAGHQECFNALWNNHTATPAEILEALGSNAVSVFSRGYDLVRFLLGADTGHPIASMEASEYTPPVAYTPHPDGTVTLT